MHDPLDFEKNPALKRLARMRLLVTLALALEQGARHLWRTASWIAFFCGLWMLQLPQAAGQAGAATFSTVFFIGMAVILRRDLPRLRRPRRAEIDRRLEQDSGLRHRPIGIIDDRLVNPRHETTRLFWQKGVDDAYGALAKLRAGLPRPVLAVTDPYALRTAAVLVLLAGAVVAGNNGPQRIAAGLVPFTLPAATLKPSPVTVWITPPAYTGVAPVILEKMPGRGDKPLTVPEGSIVKARVNGGFMTPQLAMGDTRIPLTETEPGNWALETAATAGTHLKIKQGPFTRASIAYDYVIDTPPVLAVKAAPETLTKGESRLTLGISDDYGVSDLSLNLTLSPLVEDRPLGDDYAETRAMASAPGQETEIQPVYDLSWHPWAGLPVIITLEARDKKGQKSAPAKIEITLPERQFNHPVAAQLAELRKRLIWVPTDSIGEVAEEIETIMTMPGQFRGDKVVFLALRTASSRLYYNQSAESVSAVIELLWDVAVRIEDGNLPHAARNLQQARENLEKILADPSATDEQIAKAMQDMREAMSQYFQELAREIQKRMAANGDKTKLSPEMFSSMIQPDDLGAFLDRLQSQALSGERDEARKMLSDLQKFMDGLGSSMNAEMPEEMQFMMEGINEMQQLIEKQQALLDQTRQQAGDTDGGQDQHYPETMPFDELIRERLKQWGMEEMPPPETGNKNPNPEAAPQADTSPHKTEQDALRFVLGQLMLEADEKLGEIPQGMQDAEQEMRNSADALGRSDPGSSIPHQEKAIEHLQQSMQDMAQQMQQMMENMTVFSMGGGALDPLGRPMQDGDRPGMFPGSRVKIPEEAERKRVQEILRILRQRAGEIDRPDYELEYYRRLLKQF